MSTIEYTCSATEVTRRRRFLWHGVGQTQIRLPANDALTSPPSHRPARPRHTQPSPCLHFFRRSAHCYELLEDLRSDMAKVGVCKSTRQRVLTTASSAGSVMKAEEGMAAGGYSLWMR